VQADDKGGADVGVQRHTGQRPDSDGMIHPGELSAEQVGDEDGALHKVDDLCGDRVERIYGRYDRYVVADAHASIFTQESNVFLWH